MLVLIDADYMVYSCGFATETVKYDVTAVTPDGEVHEAILDSLSSVSAWQDRSKWPLGTRLHEPVRIVEPEPLAHATHLINKTISGILHDCEDFCRAPVTAQYFLTGKNNFREAIATIRKYKGNRDALHKPHHYAALREYLIKRFKAQVIHGREADDEVTMRAAAHGYDPERVCIVSVDKDLWTVPGLHFNYKSGDFSVVSEDEAEVNFYRQLLTGDVTDNIVGCYKAGASAAEAIINDGMTEVEKYEACLKRYETSLGIPSCPYAGRDARSVLLENARLLWMLRHPEDTWVPPTERGAASQSPAPATSGESCATLTSGGSTTSTNPEPSRSQSPCPDSSAKPAGKKSRGKRATRQTSS